ncbi:MAG: hypothetical protein ACOVLB_07640 [Candidatus Nanopelagicus sp.]
MPYTNKIKMLEESRRLVEDQIFHMEKSGKIDAEKLSNLKEIKEKYVNELRLLHKAQWENDHDTVDIEDER